MQGFGHIRKNVVKRLWKTAVAPIVVLQEIKIYKATIGARSALRRTKIQERTSDASNHRREINGF
jgi:hypothetical protein